MRFLFDVLHPAHVHVLRHPRSLLIERGHEVLVTARAKDVTVDLLIEFNIDHTVISEQASGTIRLAKELTIRTARLGRIAKDEQVDALVGLMGPSIALVGRLRRIPSFVLYDTEIATQTNRWVYPMASEVITPRSYSAPVRGRHVTYAGYHELFYLHPKRFTPNPKTLSDFGLGADERFIVVRLPGLDSSHDTNERRTPTDRWVDWFETIEKTHRVLVSSEAPLPRELASRRLSGPVTAIHDVLAFASLVVGESATMATEAAVLGTPAVFIGQTSRGYVDDIERRYGLIRRYRPDQFATAAEQATRWLIAEAQWAADAQGRLIADHIDVSPWLVNHLESALDTGSPA